MGRGRVSHAMPKEKKRADRRGRPARSGDELTTTASCQGEKATASQDQARKASTGDRSWHGSRSDLEREAIGVRPAPPCPDIGSGRHAEGREGEVVPDRGGRQQSTGDVVEWRENCVRKIIIIH